jgi:hypothetical protein
MGRTEDSKQVAADEVVMCRFLPIEVSGSTAKFECELQFHVDDDHRPVSIFARTHYSAM